jgi:predicted RNase H-like HicB family nuclease
VNREAKAVIETFSPENGKPLTISGRPGDDAKHYQVRAVQLAIGGDEEMKASAKSAKILEWSEEDQCYVGSAPGLILAGCHGDDEKKVFDELCQIVEEAIELYTKDGKPLPPPTSRRDFATKMQNVA